MDPLKAASAGAPAWVSIAGLVLGAIGTLLAIVVFWRGEYRWRFDRMAPSLTFWMTPNSNNRENVHSGQSLYNWQIRVENIGSGPAFDVESEWLFRDPNGSQQTRTGRLDRVEASGPVDGAPTTVMLTEMFGHVLMPELGPLNADRVLLAWKLKPHGRRIKRVAPVDLRLFSRTSMRLYRPWSFALRRWLAARVGFSLVRNDVDA